MKTGLITSNTYQNHNTGDGHPERIDRVTAIIDNFKKLNNKNLIWKKPSKYKKELLENGVSSDRLGKMVNPAGLDLKARTPSEIALSILAEIVQLLRDDNTLDNQVVSESEEKAIDPVCGMKVDTELTKITFQFKSQDYHFCCNGCKTKFKNNPELFLITS